MEIYWESSLNFNNLPFYISMTYQQKSIGNPVEISMKQKEKSIGNPFGIQYEFK